MRNLGHRRQQAGAADLPPVDRLGRGRGLLRRVRGQRLGGHVQRTDGGHDAVQRAFGVHHRQDALHQVEIQRVHAVHAAQLLADQRFLGGAVHLPDAQARQRLAGAGDERGRAAARQREGLRRVVVAAAGAGGMVVPGVVMPRMIVARVIVTAVVMSGVIVVRVIVSGMVMARMVVRVAMCMFVLLDHR